MLTSWENVPLYYAYFSSVVNNDFAQNIDYGYMLEPPRQDSSNEYPQRKFWIKNNENCISL